MVFTESSTTAPHPEDPGSWYKDRSYNQHDFPVIAHGHKYLMRNTVGDRRLVRFHVAQLAVRNFSASDYMKTTDNYFDAELTGAPVHTLADCILNYQITNNAVSLNPILMMIAQAHHNRHELRSNGSYPDDTIYADQMYWDYIYWLNDFDERTARAQGVGMDQEPYSSQANGRSAWGMFDETPLTITANSTRQYYMPIINALTTANLYLPVKRVDPQFRFYGAVNPITSDNSPLELNTTSISCSGMQMFVTGWVYDPEVMQQLSIYYSSGITCVRGTVHERFTTPFNTLPAGGAQNLGDTLLTAFNGSFYTLLFALNRNDATRQRLIYGSNRGIGPADVNPLPISKITLKNSGGQPVFFTDMDATMWQFAINPGTFKNSAIFAYKYYMPMYLCTEPERTHQTGASSGGLFLDGKFIAQVGLAAQTGTSSSWTTNLSTGINLVIYGFRYGDIKLNGQTGNITVQKY